ncbi:bifunctional precorrin-2 dehydrogenase/sirohydrochlorin ferrochelatase [Desulfatiferula olefinivorans]
MNHYPIFLTIRNRPCLIIGGGAVGTRKATTLIRCGARVTVLSPDTTEELAELVRAGQVTLISRPYTSDDLDGILLVFCATNDRDLNRRIAADAEIKGVLCNVADIPDASSFIVPSVVSRGDLTLAVSTGGASPAFAKKLRRDLERQFGEEYAVFLALMGRIRKKLLTDRHDPRGHKVLFERLIDGGLLDNLKTGDADAVRSLLGRVLGPGFDGLVDHEDTL